MRARFAIVGLLALAAALGAGGESDLTGAAAAWLASLDEAQRGEALYAFEDDERFDLRLAPIWLEGLRRDAMSEEQWDGWRRVLATTLSAEGLRQVETVISLEREVGRRDRESFVGGVFGRFAHGEDRYYVALFGEPGAGRPWGLRFDGHHVSLNWTVAADGSVSTTPEFLGAEPRRVPDGWERAGLRALAREEDAARSLWSALDADQRKRSELEFRLARGPAGGNRALFLGEGDRIDPGAPAGLARAQMSPEQGDLLDALVDTFLSRLARPLHEARGRTIDARGRDRLHFAWAGSFAPGEPVYYRVHGPTLVIEFDNTVAEADHVHSIVREIDGDFGRDLLAEHYERHHAPLALAREP